MAGVAAAVLKALALPAIATTLSTTASPIAAAFIVGIIASVATAAVALFFNAVHGIGLGVGAAREPKKNILANTDILLPIDDENNSSDKNAQQQDITASLYLDTQLNAVYIVTIQSDTLPDKTYFQEKLMGKNQSKLPVMIRLIGKNFHNTLFTLNQKGDPVIFRDNLTEEEIKRCNTIFKKEGSHTYTKLTEKEKNLFRKPEPENNLNATKGSSFFSNSSSNQNKTNSTNTYDNN